MNHIITKEECEKVLHKYSNVPKQLISYQIKRLSDKVLGFLGEHYMLNVIYSHKNQPNQPIQTSFFLKSIPRNNENQFKYMEQLGVFDKEIFVYNNLINKLLKLVSKPFAATCYLTKAGEYLILEDLANKSFRIVQDLFLSPEYCLSALEAIARFHASSIIFEESMSTEDFPYRLVDHFKKETIETTYSFTKGHPRTNWTKTGTECLVQLSNFLTNDLNIGIKIKEFVFTEIPKLIEPSKRYRNVVTHDDLWKNNMMFNDKKECVLIDFQFCKYTPPIYDVLVFLYCNMDREILEENLNTFLSHYYSTFERELRRHKLNPDEILSKAEFMESAETYKTLALYQACVNGCYLYISEEASERVISNIDSFEQFTFKDRASFVVPEFKKDAKFRERYNHILLPFFKLFS